MPLGREKQSKVQGGAYFADYAKNEINNDLKIIHNENCYCLIYFVLIKNVRWNSIYRTFFKFF